MFTRGETKVLKVGSVALGADEPVRVESMTKTDTRDVGTTLAQLERLAAAGCELARAAVPDVGAVAAFGELVRRSPLPLMADIHFDYRLALACLDAGAGSIRLNPGNIKREEHWAAVGREMAARGVPARVGVNAGSLDDAVIERHGGRTAQAMAASALDAVKRLEESGLEDIIVSAKATSPAVTLGANRLIAEELSYPLHVGVTEAGFGDAGVVRAVAGLSLILAAGLGNTIRVSLTDAPEREVAVAYEVLRALGLRRRGPTVISCPGCGRAQVDVGALARRVAESLNGDFRDVKVAVMGCAVNGPGEASEADVGIAGGKGRGVVYRKGRVVRAAAEADLVAALLEELDKLAD
ncbi:MAG: flavodoxin-dependent (E)-4-hydroxy-3-methylbut-2-enyl-diphosphate synthase [candidate division Zixibacteria bacterium]|nr:flavodoxin-dependent (E)-4-hydroxy-3-methylbut-2-enyl-diphosphate synthase [candidate division Zixibacteria bacterium]